VAHGAEDLGGDDASQLGGPGSVDEWFSTAALTEQMQDKLLLLCVCHGYSQDAIDAFLEDSSFVLGIVAPTSALEASEAEAFFPSFLGALRPASAIEIDPVAVKETLEQINHFSGGKMKHFSKGLPS
jgi:hypothetical protein